MKTILVATDFSPASINAANYATDMASHIRANVLLLHVYQVPFSYADVPIPINHEETLQGIALKLKSIKDDLAKNLDPIVRIDTEVQPGVFFQSLKEVCERTRPYAVIMGSQGTSAIQHLLFGSNSVYVLKHLMWPVIAVPPDVEFTAIRKIGLACDFDKINETIPLEELTILVNDFKASLHVLNTGRKTDFNADLVFGTQQLRAMLKDLKPEYHFITVDDRDQGIIKFAEGHRLDLLIVFPKPHDLFESIMHTSHTKKLVLHCHVPVMALHQSSA